MNVLVDTSIWVDHLRVRNTQLSSLLLEGRVLVHDLVIGELACGGIKNRAALLSSLQALPRAPNASLKETLFFIEKHGLAGSGLNYVDISILAATRLGRCGLLTSDQKLALVFKTTN